MRVNHVKKARKDQGTCGKCGKAIKAGDAYKWAKGRFGPRMVRCDSCAFRQSDLTSSDKLSQVYAAQEAAENAMAEWDPDDANEAKQILETLAETIREVAEEYQQSADSIRDNFAESPTADECEEKANELESWVDECEDAASECEEFDEEGVEFDEDEVEAEEGESDEGHAERVKTAREEAVKRAKEEWKEELQSRMEAISNCPL
jgi:hypothetical protein